MLGFTNIAILCDVRTITNNLVERSSSVVVYRWWKYFGADIVTTRWR